MTVRSLGTPRSRKVKSCARRREPSPLYIGCSSRKESATTAYLASASICRNDRVVFNIGGNKYRLVVEVQYQAGIVWVKFVGTHAQYDLIDVETVNDH